jgi:hypothetical protein
VTSPLDTPVALFRDPAAAVGGGLILVPAGVLVAVSLLLHPLPGGGFEEQASILSTTPLWGAIHAGIAFGFVLTAVGTLLLLAAGGPGHTALGRASWAAICIGMVFFAGVALVNAWVMHPLAAAANAGQNRALFDAFNGLLVGFGWLGNPLFLAGLTGVAYLEVRDHAAGLPGWLAVGGLLVILLSWLRGIGSASGLYFLEPFIFTNIPAFLWLSWYGCSTRRVGPRLCWDRSSRGTFLVPAFLCGTERP